LMQAFSDGCCRQPEPVHATRRVQASNMLLLWKSESSPSGQLFQGLALRIFTLGRAVPRSGDTQIKLRLSRPQISLGGSRTLRMQPN